MSENFIAIEGRDHLLSKGPDVPMVINHRHIIRIQKNSNTEGRTPITLINDVVVWTLVPYEDLVSQMSGGPSCP